MGGTAAPIGVLPPARSVLAVVAHPDDESFGVGAVVSSFVASGAEVAVLCFTHGEASTLGVGRFPLAKTRAAELRAAARVLGIAATRLLAHPDGGLADVPLGEMARAVEGLVDADAPELLLVFDEGGVTGHRDHRRATQAALAASGRLPILAWALDEQVAKHLNAEHCTAFVGRSAAELDFTIEVDRRRQLEAIACHQSQSTDNAVLWHRLEHQGGTECLRWLRPPSGLNC